MLGHIIQAQDLLRGKWRLLEAASTMICGDLSLHGGLTLPPSQAYLAFSFNDDDWYSSGRPAVFGW